jgi:hypothetical protein
LEALLPNFLSTIKSKNLQKIVGSKNHRQYQKTKSPSLEGLFANFMP